VRGVVGAQLRVRARAPSTEVLSAALARTRIRSKDLQAAQASLLEGPLFACDRSA
jgi:hypothetical protein